MSKRRSEYLKRRHQRQRRRALSILGERCVFCGAKDGLDQQEKLTFDHINRGQKNMEMGAAFAYRKWEDIANELVLCQVLCRSCHATKSNAERGHPAALERLAVITAHL